MNKLPFPIFIGALVLILIAASSYLSSRIIRHLPSLALNKKTLRFFFGVFISLQVIVPLSYRVFNLNAQFVLISHLFSYTCLGGFFCIFFYSLFGEFLTKTYRFISNLAGKYIFNQTNNKEFQNTSMERRTFLGLGVFSIASSAAGVAQAIGDPKIEDVVIFVDNLPEDLEDLTIAQISDLHIGPTIGYDYVKRVVELTNNLQPDIVALTGDMVDGNPDSLRDRTSLLGGLTSKYGTFYVTGNHEYYWGAEDWVNEFKSLNFKVLMNSHELIQVKDSYLAMAGVTDARAHQRIPSHKSDPHLAIKDIPPGVTKILLAHQPISYLSASTLNFDLQLSGHTHGGQFFPFNLAVAAVQPYYRGLYRLENQKWIYTHRGTGYWGPPIRLGVPAEIALIRLKKTI